MEELAKLKQLVELANTGNYRRAASNLGITHSALSQTISKMEERYGIDLFVRNKMGTTPTAYGERLIESAREAIRSLTAAERELSMMQALEIGRLIVGIDPGLSEGLLSLALIELMKLYPKLQFTVLPRNWRTMEEDLIDDHIDIFIGLAPDRWPEQLDYRKFNIIPSPLACRTGHPLLDTKELTIESLFEYPFMGGDVPDWFLQQVVDAYPQYFTTINDVRNMFLVTHDMGLIRKLIPATDAIGFVPESLIQAGIREGRIAIIDKADRLFNFKLQGVIATKSGKPLSPAAQKLSQIVYSLVS